LKKRKYLQEEIEMKTEKPHMLTIKEASKQVDGLSEFRIRQMCINKEIPSIKAGNKYLICEQVLWKYLFGELKLGQEA
jgi:excisionase family DNA binding protein